MKHTIPLISREYYPNDRSGSLLRLSLLTCFRERYGIIRHRGGGSSNAEHEAIGNLVPQFDDAFELVSSLDVPMPYNHTLELAIQPSVDKIVKSAQSVLYI